MKALHPSLKLLIKAVAIGVIITAITQFTFFVAIVVNMLQPISSDGTLCASDTLCTQEPRISESAANILFHFLGFPFGYGRLSLPDETNPFVITFLNLLFWTLISYCILIIIREVRARKQKISR